MSPTSSINYSPPCRTMYQSTPSTSPPSIISNRTAASIYSYFQLVLLTSVACGLEFCVCAGFVYIPSMLLEHDIDGAEMSVILSLAPLVAIVSTPYIAKMSDDCQSRSNGGRKPIILTFSVGVFMSLCLLGSYQNLALLLFPATQSFQDRASKFLLVAGIFGLDYCTQVCLNPVESLISDIYKNTRWAELSYAVYSSMLALGSCVGYLIVALDWNIDFVTAYFKSVAQETVIFYFLAMLFMLSVLATIISLSESSSGPKKDWRLKFSPEPPRDFNLISNDSLEDNPNDGSIYHEPKLGRDDGYESNNSDYSDSELLLLVFENDGIYNQIRQEENGKDNRLIAQLYQKLIKPANSSSMGVYNPKSSFTKNNISTGPSFIYNVITCFYCSRVMHWPTKKVLKIYVKARSAIRFIIVWLKWPMVLRRLFWAHLFMWTSVMIHNLFYADYMGRYIFLGDPKSGIGTPARIAYNSGIRSASWGLLYHSLLGAVASPLLERFIINPQAMSIKRLYITSLLLFDGSMFVLIIVPPLSAGLCNLVTTFTGVTLAVVNSVPFILLSKYHTNKSKYYFDYQTKPVTQQQSPSIISHYHASPPAEDEHKTLLSSSTTTTNQRSTTNNSGNTVTTATKTNHNTIKKLAQNSWNSSTNSATYNLLMETANGNLNKTANFLPPPPKTVIISDCRKNFGIGSDIAVLDIGYFMAQIIASVLIGQIIRLTPDARYYMLSALFVSSLGCYFAKHIIASDAELLQYHSQH